MDLVFKPDMKGMGMNADDLRLFATIQKKLLQNLRLQLLSQTSIPYEAVQAEAQRILQEYTEQANWMDQRVTVSKQEGPQSQKSNESARLRKAAVAKRIARTGVTPLPSQRFKNVSFPSGNESDSFTDSNSKLHTKKKKRYDSKRRDYPRPWINQARRTASSVPSDMSTLVLPPISARSSVSGVSEPEHCVNSNNITVAASGCFNETFTKRHESGYYQKNVTGMNPADADTANTSHKPSSNMKKILKPWIDPNEYQRLKAERAELVAQELPPEQHNSGPTELCEVQVDPGPDPATEATHGQIPNPDTELTVVSVTQSSHAHQADRQLDPVNLTEFSYKSPDRENGPENTDAIDPDPDLVTHAVTFNDLDQFAEYIPDPESSEQRRSRSRVRRAQKMTSSDKKPSNRESKQSSSSKSKSRSASRSNSPNSYRSLHKAKKYQDGAKISLTRVTAMDTLGLSQPHIFKDFAKGQKSKELKVQYFNSTKLSTNSVEVDDSSSVVSVEKNQGKDKPKIKLVKNARSTSSPMATNDKIVGQHNIKDVHNAVVSFNEFERAVNELIDQRISDMKVSPNSDEKSENQEPVDVNSNELQVVTVATAEISTEENYEAVPGSVSQTGNIDITSDAKSVELDPHEENENQIQISSRTVSRNSSQSQPRQVKPVIFDEPVVKGRAIMDKTLLNPKVAAPVNSNPTPTHEIESKPKLKSKSKPKLRRSQTSYTVVPKIITPQISKTNVQMSKLSDAVYLNRKPVESLQTDGPVMISRQSSSTDSFPIKTSPGSPGLIKLSPATSKPKKSFGGRAHDEIDFQTLKAELMKTAMADMVKESGIKLSEEIPPTILSVSKSSDSIMMDTTQLQDQPPMTSSPKVESLLKLAKANIKKKVSLSKNSIDHILTPTPSHPPVAVTSKSSISFRSRSKPVEGVFLQKIVPLTSRNSNAQSKPVRLRLSSQNSSKKQIIIPRKVKNKTEKKSTSRPQEQTYVVNVKLSQLGISEVMKFDIYDCKFHDTTPTNMPPIVRLTGSVQTNVNGQKKSCGTSPIPSPRTRRSPSSSKRSVSVPAEVRQQPQKQENLKQRQVHVTKTKNIAQTTTKRSSSKSKDYKDSESDPEDEDW